MAWYAAWMGLWQPWQAQLDVAYMAVGHLLPYAYMRSRSLRTSDQTLLLTQIGFAVSVTNLTYGLGGVARASLLVVFAMHILFAMLTLSPRQARNMGVATLTSIPGTSLTMCLRRPDAFAWQQEVLHRGVALSILPVMVLVAVWVSRMRRDLSAQNDKLLALTTRLKTLVQRDEGTSLYNRRHMVSVMQAKCRKAALAGTPSAVAMLDLDPFKRINDTLGHHAGDVVLQAFAKAASLPLVCTDVLARWGGEGFLLLVPATTPTEAVLTVDRIREEFKQLDLQVDGKTVQIKASAAVTVWQQDGPMAQVLERTDQLLYRAKHHGRDCTERRCTAA